MSVLKNMSRFDETRSFKVWLFAIARNKCMDIMRKRSRFVLFSVFSRDAQESPIEDTIVSEEPLPNDMAAKVETIDLVKNAIAGLPFEQKTAILLREYEGMAYKQISETMDCSVEKVKILLFRAREALFRKLEPVLKEMEI